MRRPSPGRSRGEDIAFRAGIQKGRAEVVAEVDAVLSKWERYLRTSSGDWSLSLAEIRAVLTGGTQ